MKQTAFQVAAYGAITIAGGVDGFLSKGSVPSIVAGLACGGALFAGAYGLYDDETWGWWTSLVVSVLLIGRFAPKFKSSGIIYPHGIMAALGIWIIGALIVAYINQVEQH
jgi:uncharacterized membrane protein (UPF0136 family)